MNSFVIITIVKTEGSVPRHVGAKMFVDSNGSSKGTIGGGTLEYEAIKDALEFLRKRASGSKTYPLGPLLGQCCGGNVELFFEIFTEPKEIAIFGAGHIAEELVPMLKKLGFHIKVIDERLDRLNLPSFNIADTKINELPEDAFKSLNFDNNLYVIVLTHAHIYDEKIVEYLLDKPLKYIGMIGSKTKWEKFKARYRAKGFKDEQIGKVKTPIGLDIGGETPFEIAVSIVAELISL